jgi:adenosylcobinamide kinase/adenosylcobinamide-phosphate guanylyltransferase
MKGFHYESVKKKLFSPHSRSGQAIGGAPAIATSIASLIYLSKPLQTWGLKFNQFGYTILGDIIVYLGGAKSGKTLAALSKTSSYPAPRYYLATAQALDSEMADRIKKHQAERGPDWQTIEEPLELVSALEKVPGQSPVMLDCLTLWLTNLMGRWPDCCDTAPFLAEQYKLVEAAAARQGPLIIVSNEVGGGVVPMEAVSRFFRDLCGLSHQFLAKAASEVYMVIAGLPLKLK